MELLPGGATGDVGEVCLHEYQQMLPLQGGLQVLTADL